MWGRSSKQRKAALRRRRGYSVRLGKPLVIRFSKRERARILRGELFIDGIKLVPQLTYRAN